MIVSQTPVWLGLLSLIAGSVADRMPPKLLKVTTNVGKALQAGRYSGSMIPLPPKIVLQANFARKEVHLPGRSYRRKRRPHRESPPKQIHREYPSESYGRGKYRGTHRPSGEKFRSPSSSRPPYREPDYYEQEVEDNGSDIDYDFEDSPYRSFSSDQDVQQQAAEFHPSTYQAIRNKNVNQRDPEELYEAATVRKARPAMKKLKNGPIPFRSASPSYRPPYYHHSEENDEAEEEEFEDVSRPRKRVKAKRPKPREKPKYFNEEAYDNSDNFYHDRAFEAVTTKNPRDFEPFTNYRQLSEEANNSRPRIRPDYPGSGQDPTLKPLWNNEETPLRHWAPTVEPKLVAQPIRVIPVWHILQQIPAEPLKQAERQTATTDESKSVFAWADPKPILNGFKYSSQKKQEAPQSTVNDSGNNGIVANRLVADTIKWNQIGQQSHAVVPSNFPAFNYSENFWSSGRGVGSNEKKWSVPLSDGDIIYGSRVSSEKSKQRVPDIGYGQGMELVNENEDGGSWQVY